MAVSFCLSPFFVFAKNCQVDKTDTKNNVYKTIADALKDGCNAILVNPGEYVEDITIGDGVKITGAKKKTIIKGVVKINGTVGLKNVHVDEPKIPDSNGRTIGIKVMEGAKAFLYEIEVSNADIGIETSEGSKLTVVDSKINNNKKGFYIRYGTDIDLRNNEVTNNTEEAIDIRAHIHGGISGNTIVNNGESGIEVVMGESKMKINNNIIKNNHASGIALQFYKDNNGLGDFFIAGNELSENDSYGIDCKRPSGGKTEKQYWAKSSNFGYNKIRGNKKGLIGGGCKFHGPKKWEVSRTKEAQKKLIKVLDKMKNDYKNMPEKEMVKIINQKMSSDEQLEQEGGWWQQEVDAKKKREIDKIVDEIEWEYKETVEKNKNLLESTSKIREFFLGPHKQVLEDIKGDLDKYNFNVKKAQKKIDKIELAYIKVDAVKQVEKINKHKELEELYNQYKNKFGIWPWIKSFF